MTNLFDIKRILLTTATCLIAALLSFYLCLINEIIFIIPIIFSIAVPLTNLDRIITKKKYQAFVLSAMLTTILFFISVPLGLLIGQSFLGYYSIYIVCLLSGLLALLINSVFIKIDNIKFGLLAIGLLSLTIPFLTDKLKGSTIFDITFFGDPTSFFIIWQTVIGLGLAISIWTKTNRRKKRAYNIL